MGKNRELLKPSTKWLREYRPRWKRWITNLPKEYEWIKMPSLNRLFQIQDDEILFFFKGHDDVQSHNIYLEDVLGPNSKKKYDRRRILEKAKSHVRALERAAKVPMVTKYGFLSSLLLDMSGNYRQLSSEVKSRIPSKYTLMRARIVKFRKRDLELLRTRVTRKLYCYLRSCLVGKDLGHGRRVNLPKTIPYLNEMVANLVEKIEPKKAQKIFLQES